MLSTYNSYSFRGDCILGIDVKRLSSILLERKTAIRGGSRAGFFGRGPSDSLYYLLVTKYFKKFVCHRKYCSLGGHDSNDHIRSEQERHAEARKRMKRERSCKNKYS